MAPVDITSNAPTFLAAASLYLMRAALGAGSTGDTVFTANTPAAARFTLGSGTVGDAIFQAGSAAALGGGNDPTKALCGDGQFRLLGTGSITQPNPPAGFSVTANSDATVTVSWTNPADIYFTNVEIRAGQTNDAATGTVIYSGASGPQTISRTVGTWYFWIRSVIVGGFFSAWSASGAVQVDHGPTFASNAASITMMQDGTVDLHSYLVSSDLDPGQTLTFTPYTAPSHGTLTLTGVTVGSGSGVTPSGGTATYAPTPGYTGSDVFAIQVGDGSQTSTKTFTVTVNANTTPTFVGGSTTLTLPIGAASDLKADLHVSDTDPDQTLTWSQSSAPSQGALSFSGATASSGSTDIAVERDQNRHVAPIGVARRRHRRRERPVLGGDAVADLDREAVGAGVAGRWRIGDRTSRSDVAGPGGGGGPGKAQCAMGRGAGLAPGERLADIHVADVQVGFQVERGVLGPGKAGGSAHEGGGRVRHRDGKRPGGRADSVADLDGKAIRAGVPRGRGVRDCASWGANNGTTIVDAKSGSNLTVSGVVTATDIVEFGAAAGKFVSSSVSAPVRLPTTTNLQLTGDFTMECWIYITTTNRDCIILGEAGGLGHWRINHDSSGKIGIYGSNGWTESGTISLSANTWHHVALCRASGKISHYVDGARVGAEVNDASTFNYSGGAVGMLPDYAGTVPFVGRMDDLRITKGVARYTGTSYTVPTQAFPTS